jgi:hypothetical protein
MQLKQPQRMEVSSAHLQAHILSGIRKLTALLKYQGIVQNKESIKFMNILCDMLVVADSGGGVCVDPGEKGAILETGGPGPPEKGKGRQLSPDSGGEGT